MKSTTEAALSDAAIEAQFSENALEVLRRRYLRRNERGEPAETVAGMFHRVAHHIAAAENEAGTAAEAEARFFTLLAQLRFVPNSPTFTGAGTPLGQLAACFVLPIEDDMGKEPGGIFQTLRDAALIQQTGGGNGFSFSRLRPKAALVFSSMGKATGPVGFLRVYDRAFGEIAQGGCLLPETLVFTERGLLRLDEIADPQIPGWQPHSLKVATDTDWRVSPRAFNNGVSPVFRVHTREGLSLTGTATHKVKVMSDDGPRWQDISGLQEGDWILIRLGQQQGVLQPLRHPSREHGNQDWPKLPAVVDKELAFFLGYLTGDGFVAAGEDDHRVGVSVAQHSYLFAEMPALLNQLFGVTVHCQQKQNDKSATFVMDNRAVKEFLQLNGLDKPRSRDAFVPRLIRQSPPEVVGAYLRGLLEADGAVSHGYPQLTTTSPRLAEEVATLMMGLGCPVRVWSLAPGVNHYGKASVYHVRIESSVGLQAWREHIGCDPRSRFAACHSWESDQRRESSYVLPYPRYWLQPVLDAITLEQVDKKGRSQGRKFRSVNPHLRHNLLRYLRGDRNLTRSTYDELRRVHPEFAGNDRSPENWWFVQVSGVEAAGESPTLDLEVDETHTYLAYGMVTHNTRRGANMSVLRVDHPDIEAFVTCKTSEDAITNFNISVGILDAFMEAVEADGAWTLRFPDIESPLYRKFNGTLEQAEAAGVGIKVYRTVRARELFSKIVRQAWQNGEPGMLFLDAAQRDNPVPHLGRYECTNPCGEQFLLPYENCCLGSVNLARLLGHDAEGQPAFDWEGLAETVHDATRFLDDVISVNAFVPAVPQLREAAYRTRRIGLGIMGLADVLIHLRIPYGSEAAQDFAAQLMEFVRYHAMQASIELAQQRGAFPAIEGSVYDPHALTWQPPHWPIGLNDGPRYDWGRPPLAWESIMEGIRAHGIRNAAQLTVAPTGTIATVSGVEGYGCEPIFALAYTRYVQDEGQTLPLRYFSPAFVKALEEAHIDAETRERIFQKVAPTGSCQGVEEVPEALQRVFVVASDIPAEGHIRMQAALQAFTDASISKTINFPATATEEDVATAFRLAWHLGCKGLTVYVAGSREKVVLETEATRQQKTSPPWQAPHIRPRPQRLNGRTYRVPTPVGTAFITVNMNGNAQPFEVFLNVGKAGSETAAVAEAIGRLISLNLRLPSPLEPRRRLEEIVAQLGGIGGGRPLGFGHQRVLSLPDGVAQALNDYLNEMEEHDDAALHADEPESATAPTSALTPPTSPMQVGDLCPSCGQATMVYTEGCRRCYVCGHSEC